jgi:ribokinase
LSFPFDLPEKEILSFRKGEWIMAGITVVGSINMDLIVRTPRLPQLGETILGEDMVKAGGGKGANQAVACARLGAEVSFIGNTGNDEFGKQLISDLEREGIDCSCTGCLNNVSTGVALITVVKEGDNAIVVSPGANMLLSPEDLHKGEERFRTCKAALFQLEIPLETLAQGLYLSRKHGLLTILDPAPFREIPDDLLGSVDILVPNSIEIQQMSGEQDIKAAAQALIRRGVKRIVLTAGAKGAFLFEQDLMTRIPAPAVTPVDTTGAGDAFAGGIAVALSEGKRVEDAIRFANCSGALACTVLGAQTSLPRRAAVKKLYMETYS